MQTKNATHRNLLLHLLISSSIAFAGSGLTHAQDSAFPLSPARHNPSAPRQAEPGTMPQRLPGLDVNDLRQSVNSTQQQTRPAFDPIQFPSQQRPNQANPNSILQKQSPNFPAMEPISGTPKFNPQEYKLPPIHQNGSANPAQPARDIPTVSPNSFRMLDRNTPSDIRTVSANLQDDGRESARGTQPLGARNQTQTVQQQGGFQLKPQQPTVNPNLSPPTNGNAGQGQRQFNAQPPLNTQRQFNNQPPLNAQPTRQQPNPTFKLNSGATYPDNPPAGNQRFANNNSNANNLTTQPPTTGIDTSLAKNLMSQFSVNSVSQPLPGQPIAMQEILQLTPPQNRTAMVNQYWATYQAWCEMICSARHVDALKQIIRPNNPAEKSLLNTAQSIATNELLAAEIQLTKAQSKLQRFIPNSQHDLVLPLPSDQPLITSYTTHYDYYASRRAIPNDIRNIASSLPTMLKLVTQQALTAHNSKSSMEQIRTFVQGGQAPISEVLQAVQMWSDANKHVVRSVVDYNRSIANYSLNIMGSGKSVEQLTLALVGKPNQQSAPTLNPNVRQATLPQEFQQNRMATPTPSNPSPSFNARPRTQTNPSTQLNFGGNSGSPAGNTPPFNSGASSSNSNFQSVPNSGSGFRNN